MFSSSPGRGCLGGQHLNNILCLSFIQMYNFLCCRTWLPWWTTPGSISSPRWTQTDGRSPPMRWVHNLLFFSERKKVEGKKVHNHEHNFKHQYYLGWAVLSWSEFLFSSFPEQFFWTDLIIFLLITIFLYSSSSSSLPFEFDNRNLKQIMASEASQMFISNYHSGYEIL